MFSEPAKVVEPVPAKMMFPDDAIVTRVVLFVPFWIKRLSMVEAPDALRVKRPSFKVGEVAETERSFRKASSVAQATMPAVLVKVHAPVMVWAMEREAGPLV